MKVNIILGFFIVAFASEFASADTLDFWYAFYNNKKIKEFSEISNERIISIVSNDVKENDSISVAYHPDAPCDCKTELLIYDDNKLVLKSKPGRNTFDKLSFSLKDLLAKNPNSKTFKVYYAEEYRRSNFLLFNILLK
jgi:hypothetical protein